jgi:hypothetical protein
MEQRYSQQLITECISCFRDEDGIELSEEEAVEYLAGLGGLYLAFAAGGGAAPAALAAESPATGVRNTCGTLQITS